MSNTGVTYQQFQELAKQFQQVSQEAFNDASCQTVLKINYSAPRTPDKTTLLLTTQLNDIDEKIWDCVETVEMTIAPFNDLDGMMFAMSTMDFKRSTDDITTFSIQGQKPDILENALQKIANTHPEMRMMNATPYASGKPFDIAGHTTKSTQMHENKDGLYCQFKNLEAKKPKPLPLLVKIAQFLKAG